MFALLLTPAYLPFAVAFVVMVGIGLIEALGLGLGHLDLEGGAGIEGDGAAIGLLDWLGLGGEMPILVWLTSLLGCFTLAGLAIQQGVTAVTGAPLSWVAAGALALFAGGALNTLVANGLARILPGFETTAISADELLRYRGTILEGVARRGAPARAKVIDRHGQTHIVMVEPHDAGSAIPAGEKALLVRREGRLFYAVADDDATFRAT